MLLQPAKLVQSVDFARFQPAASARCSTARNNYRFGQLWLPLELTPLGFAGCRACSTTDVGFAFVHTTGAATSSFGMPTGAQLQGFKFYAQAVSLDAGSPNGQLALSNGVELILD